MPYECNVHATNAPVICRELYLAEDKAALDGRTLTQLKSDGTLIASIQDAAANGHWVIVDAANTSSDMLREAVYAVWLHCTYDHHQDFCAWFLYPPFLVPRHTDYFSLEGSSQRAHYSLSPARGRGSDEDDEVGQRLRISQANEHLPAALVAAAVYLRYCDSFDAEFKVNRLINAIGNSQVYRTGEFREYLGTLRPRNVVGAFELCQREDVFVALAEAGRDSEQLRDAIVLARTETGTSPMDAALSKEFQLGAQALQRLGCRSEVFDYDQLAKASFQEMLRVLLDPSKPFPFDPLLTVARVSADGNAEMLASLFYCRIDVGFAATDYPLAEAASSGSDATVWAVLDRMGATGVSPLTDERWALYHAKKVLGQCAIQCERGYVYSATSLWLIRRLLSVVPVDDDKHPVAVDLLEKAKAYPDIIAKLLNILAISEEGDTAALLRFFIKFNPSSSQSMEVLDLAFRGLSSSPAVERDAFDLLCAMVEGGEACGELFKQGVSSVLYYGYLDLSYTGPTPDSILFKAVRSGMLESVRWLLTRPSARAISKLVASGNAAGQTCLEWIIASLSQGGGDERAPFLCNVARMLLQRGCPVNGSMFDQAVSKGYGGMAFELLPARSGGTSLLVALSPLLLGQLCQRSVDVQGAKPLPPLEDIVDRSSTSQVDARIGTNPNKLSLGPLTVAIAVMRFCDDSTRRAASEVSPVFYCASLVCATQ